MGALRHASLLCILMIALLSVALLVAGTQTIDVSKPLDGPVQYWAYGDTGFVKQLPVLIFAYTCNMNVPIFYGALACAESPKYSRCYQASSHWSNVVS